ncbi:hypothetical protein CAOG_000421 [Capsaspora owczarzaki ATCC 30864]|uniref:Uncharacterized protein n=1 Tax=Capsaspora owczarzaki (strain ATCC 30864) TaxID=595528 RepID=A0A0D2WIH5_CAPO3|nr:hypothetical protein CAOG_000421 [Capsaspora owczarzaki ATCC 30864]
MNLELLDSAGQDYPEVVERYLEDGFAQTCAFNRFGTLLAAGCNDGRVVVWDFDTHSVARHLTGHVHPVSSVSWTRNSRFLLSGSSDTNVILWNVATAERMKTFRFNSAIMSCQMHPRNCDYFIACPIGSAPVLVEIATDKRFELPSDVDPETGLGTNFHTSSASASASAGLTPATFGRGGKRIFVGNPKGRVLLIDTTTRELLKHVVVATSGGSIKSIHCNKKRECVPFVTAVLFVCLCLFVCLFVCFQVLQKYQETVNRVQWKTCCFSSDAQFVIAAAQTSDRIFIWERDATGPWIKILEGLKEHNLDVVWHPMRPIIVSISFSGTIFVWNIKRVENWSAFAPDFAELEENVEYVEREDEFDIIDEEQVKKKKTLDEDELIDVETVKKTVWSSDEDEYGEEEGIFCLLPLVTTTDATFSQAVAAAKSAVEEAERQSAIEKRSADEPIQGDAKRSRTEPEESIAKAES